MYWQYNATRLQASHSFPRPVTDWGDMKGKLNDVLCIGGSYMYFFTKELYYRYSYKTHQVKKKKLLKFI